MSEYQYYEFQAIDRRLTGKQMEELRSYSTRARITPTTFVNEYSWGNFKGNEDAWMERYFDAFLYLANWGTHVFKLGLPARALDPATAGLYCVSAHTASMNEKNGRLILTFVSEDEGGDDLVEADGLLSSLISVRAELARGDLRALYLAWLLCAQSSDLDDAAVEPPVPAGLADLSPALDGFVDFLRIDTDLVDAAAAASPPLVIEPNSTDVRAWLAKFPVTEKDDLLARFIAGDDGAVANELARRMRSELEGNRGGRSAARRRSVAELLGAGEQAAQERERIATEKAAQEKAERERAAARARAKHLDQLAGKEAMLWAQVDSLVAIMKPKSYDQAMERLVDLRDLAARSDRADFQKRLDALRTAHAGKRTFIDRLRQAGL
jgi:hypothetical protein